MAQTLRQDILSEASVPIKMPLERPEHCAALLLMRIACDWKQKDLAEALGLKPRELRRFECNENGRVPSEFMLLKAAWLMGAQLKIVDAILEFIRRVKPLVHQRPVPLDGEDLAGQAGVG